MPVHEFSHPTSLSRCHLCLEVGTSRSTSLKHDLDQRRTIDRSSEAAAAGPTVHAVTETTYTFHRPLCNRVSARHVEGDLIANTDAVRPSPWGYRILQPYEWGTLTHPHPVEHRAGHGRDKIKARLPASPVPVIHSAKHPHHGERRQLPLWQNDLSVHRQSDHESTSTPARKQVSFR